MAKEVFTFEHWCLLFSRGLEAYSTRTDPSMSLLQELPYYRAIPFGLDSGSWVLVEGFAPQQSQGIQLDLAYGQFRGANIALRFKLSFEGDPSSPATASLNSFVEGLWGIEKKAATDLRRGEWFKVQFIVTSQGYKILQNDKFLFEFDHRLSPQKIRFLEMKGDIRLKEVTFVSEKSSESRNLMPPRYRAGRQAR
uniref:Galectin n=1 Tax=Pogona vitticeps TaxID=103695 RepID=A0ABM5ESW6_9SAUR